MPDFLVEILKHGGSAGILSLFLYISFKALKEVLIKNQSFLEKQTNTINEVTIKYNESIIKVVRDYEKHSSETNEAMKKLIEKIDAISKDIPDIKSTNNILREQLRKTEGLLEVIHKVNQ